MQLMEVDLNWYLQVTLTGLVLAIALLYLVRNKASRRYAENSSFGSTAADFLFLDDESRGRMAAAAVKYCAVCTSATDYRCTGCRMVYYCSGKCQLIHWRTGHKENCKDLRPLYNASPAKPKSRSTTKKASAVSARVMDTMLNDQAPTVPTASIIPEDDGLATEIDASLQSTSHDIPSDVDSDEESSLNAATSSSNLTSSSCLEENHITGPSASPFLISRIGCKVDEGGPSRTPAEHIPSLHTVPSLVQTALETAPFVTPSAPFAGEIIDNSPIQHPSTDRSSPGVQVLPSNANVPKESGVVSSCTICLDAPSEGACIPCGHLAGCMSCLDEIKAKNWGCPVCRTKIDCVIRIYAV